MKFLIISKIPRRQGLLGPMAEENIIEEVEVDSLELAKEGLHIPLDGECLIIPKEHVTVVRSRLVNEIV